MTRIESFGVRISVDEEGVHVFPSSTLESWPIRDSGGDVVAHAYGMLLRDHMGPDLAVEIGEIRVKVPIETATCFEKIVCEHLHGVLIFVTQGKIGRRVYPDSGLSIPIVFCPETRTAGGSANDILDDDEYEERFLHDRVERLISRPGGFSWIPGTMTAHRGIFRLLPNHYLDLDNFTATRFWPRNDEYRLGMSVDEFIESNVHDLRQYMSACARQYDCALSLTAGYDTRMIFCASRPVIDKMTVFTFSVPGTGIDAYLAAKICNDLGVQHNVMPVIQASEENQLRWDRMVGHAVREMNRVTHPTVAALPHDVMISGVYGNGKCNYYRADLRTINTVKLTAESVVLRMGLPSDPEVLDELTAWLKSLEWLPSSAILDLAIVEIRNGSWAMSQAPIQKAMKPSLMPLAQRSHQGGIIQVLPETKGVGLLYDKLGEALWPQAMKFPCNRFDDYRDVAAKLSKLTDFRRVRRYIRKRLA